MNPLHNRGFIYLSRRNFGLSPPGSGAAEPEGEAQVRVTVLGALVRRARAGCPGTELGGEDLARDEPPVFGQRRGEFRVRGLPVQRDPVTDLQAVRLAGVL